MSDDAFARYLMKKDENKRAHLHFEYYRLLLQNELADKIWIYAEKPDSTVKYYEAKWTTNFLKILLQQSYQKLH